MMGKKKKNSASMLQIMPSPLDTKINMQYNVKALGFSIGSPRAQPDSQNFCHYDSK